MEYLFVYGLFRDSGKRVLGECTYCGRASINGKLYKVNEFYPGYVIDKKSKVYGDIYLVDPNNLENSITSIENLINDKKNLEWRSYSEASSKGAPEAVLGKNNYLRFLTEFVVDPENVLLLKDNYKLKNERIVLFNV